MKPGIIRKSQQLGMPFSSASHRLRKAVMFRLVQRCGLDTCFRCGKPIRTVDELSIDHKEAWQYSQDPFRHFFDLDNIAFSHLRCNTNERCCSTVVRARSGYKGVVWVTGARNKKRWEAQIVANNRLRSLGKFSTPEEAARAYDKAAVQLFRGRAVTNAHLGLL